jgi:methylthioribose-1-phosphate isomerase
MTRMPQVLEWVGDAEDGFLRILDQTRLPTEIAFRDCRTIEEVWEAIRSLRVRGAPAIGIAAAYGVVVGVQSGTPIDKVIDYLRTSRPTAVNLFWALDRMARTAKESPADIRGSLLAEATAIDEENHQMCLTIGRHGASLVPNGGGVLTHCNAGSLIAGEYGTALAPLYTAHGEGIRFRVFADETRPLLQGSRLTAWELMQHGLDVTLICDNMAAQVMREGRVQMVVVGADRIAANGDTANKIGTYGLAVLAQAHRIPLYVAAPSSTFDLSIPSGDRIPIEQRDAREVTGGFGRPTAPSGVKVYNPAFDVTPAELIAAIVTERGIIRPVNATTIRAILVGSQI